MNNHIIYKFDFPNNKIYIGQTGLSFNIRLSRYKSEIYNKNGKNYNRLVNKAIRKYGWDNVKKEIICTVSEEFVDDAERYFIKKYNSNDRKFGYNLMDGGNKNKHHSEETKKLIGLYSKGKNNYWYEKDGYWKGKKNPKHSDRMKGKNHPLFNKHHSKESIEKMSKSHIGKKRTKKSKQKQTNTRLKNKIGWKSINAYIEKTEKFVGTFESGKQASEKLKINRGSISSILTGNRKSTGGYTFRYNN